MGAKAKNGARRAMAVLLLLWLPLVYSGVALLGLRNEKAEE